MELYSEFLKADGIAMIGSVIRTKKCVKGLHLLKSIVDVACDGAVMISKSSSDDFCVVSNTTACVVHADLLISVIVRYWDWYDADAINSDILDVLFALILSLVREKHPHNVINVYRFSKSGIIPALLNFCKIYLVGASRSVYISTLAAENLVNLVRVFAGAPPVPSLLDEIVKLLVLMHRPSDSFVTHDRSKFYFLLSSSTPIKTKRLSIPLVAPLLNQSMRPRERKSTMPSMRSSTYSKVRRSMSFDVSTPPNEDNWLEIVNNDSVNNRNSTRIEQDSESICETTFDTVDGIDGIDNLLITTSNKQLRDDITNKYLKSRKRVLKQRRLKNISKQKHKFQTSNREKSRTRQRSSQSDDLDSNISFLNSTSKSNDSTDMFQAYNNPGFIKVQERFFILLRDFILILPDNSVQEVLNHYVTLEILIVLANHRDVRVRTAIVNLLTIMCERLPASVITQHTKQNYWYHLGNQIALNAADLRLFNACVQWITGLCLETEQILEMNEINVTQKYGLNVLIAILPQTVANGDLSIRTFEFLNQLYEKVHTY